MVRVPPSAPAQRPVPILGPAFRVLRTAAKYSNADHNGRSSAGLVALVLVMVEPVAQPPKSVPGHLVEGPGCRSPCERDPAVPEDDHRDARVNVERGQERAAGTAGVVERDAADAVADAPDVEGPVDVARLDRAAGASSEHERVPLAADTGVWPVGGAGLVLVALGDPQGGNADRGKR